MSYESLVKIIATDLQMKMEGEVVKAVQNVGVHVDKEELIKALEYDRGQYEKGYHDGTKGRQWIPCEVDLPKEDEWVLGTVDDLHDRPEAPGLAVVQIVKGISIEERERLKAAGDPRSRTFRFCDQDGNNKRPYAWVTWGPQTYFGQEITAWMPRPQEYEAGEVQW